MGVHDFVDNFISKINLLSAVDLPDKEVIKTGYKVGDSNAYLDIRKNLPNLLSRNVNEFESNIQYHKMSQTVRVKNDTQYLILDNKNLLIPMFEFNGHYYTFTWPRNEFVKNVSRKSTRVLKVPFLDLEVYKIYDKFIDIILKEYKSENIILLRSHVKSLYYIDYEDILSSENFIENP